VPHAVGVVEDEPHDLVRDVRRGKHLESSRTDPGSRLRGSSALTETLCRRPYRLTVKVLALLGPPSVDTVTLSRPKTAFAGTLHLMRVLVQET
jgi:hypothetical protein